MVQFDLTSIDYIFDNAFFDQHLNSRSTRH